MRIGAQARMLRAIPEVKRLLDVVPIAFFRLEPSAVTLRYFQHCAEAGISLREQCDMLDIPWHFRKIPEAACAEAMLDYDDLLSASAFSLVYPRDMHEAMAFIATANLMNGHSLTESQKLFLLKRDNATHPFGAKIEDEDMRQLYELVRTQMDIFAELKWVKMHTPISTVVRAINRKLGDIWGAPAEGVKYRAAALPSEFMKIRSHGSFEMRFMTHSYHFDRVAKVLRNCMAGGSSHNGGMSQYFLMLEGGAAVYGVVYNKETKVPAGVFEVRAEGAIQFLGKLNNKPEKDAMQAFHAMIVGMTEYLGSHFNWKGEYGQRRLDEFRKFTAKIHASAYEADSEGGSTLHGERIQDGRIIPNRMILDGERIAANVITSDRVITAHEIPVGSILACDVRIQDAPEEDYAPTDDEMVNGRLNDGQPLGIARMIDAQTLADEATDRRIRGVREDYDWQAEPLQITEGRHPTTLYCGDGSGRSRDGTTLMFVHGGMEYRRCDVTGDSLIFDAPKPAPLLQRVMDRLGIAPFFSGGGVVRTDVP